jgi:hypothetical protein
MSIFTELNTITPTIYSTNPTTVSNLTNPVNPTTVSNLTNPVNPTTVSNLTNPVNPTTVSNLTNPAKTNVINVINDKNTFTYSDYNTKMLAKEAYNLQNLNNINNNEELLYSNSNKIYNLSLNEVVNNTVLTVVAIFVDLLQLQKKYSKQPINYQDIFDIFTKEDRLIYFGVFLIFLSLLLMVLFISS